MPAKPGICAFFALLVFLSVDRSGLLHGQPAPRSGWQVPTSIWRSTGYTGGAADGSLVCALVGKRVICSEDEGTTWREPVVLADAGEGFLERPLAVRGETVAVFAIKLTAYVRDWLGPRPLGEYWLTISTDRGRTFRKPMKVSDGLALRGSVTIEGGVIHMVWMDYRDRRWEVYYRRYAGGSLGPETVLARGDTTAVGAERPSVAASGDTVYAVWKDARDRKPPCTIESGAVLPQCTEIYGRRSLDGGATWEPARRLTHGEPYSGRPTVAMEGRTILVSYDHRVAGARNDIGLLRSTDNGDTWAQSLVIQDEGESTHSSLAISRGEVLLTWIGPKIRTSGDSGQTWTAVTSLGGVSGVPAVGLTDHYMHVIYDVGDIRYSRKPRARVAASARP